jgi:hypothetical protein
MTTKGEELVFRYVNTTKYDIDYISHSTFREKCGCIKTTVKYDKDYHDFEEVCYESVIDKCSKCI